VAALVWFTTGIAIWHFTVFLPDRFWGGIVGAFLGAAAGAMITGAIVHIAAGQGIGETDIGTVLAAIPGTLAGLGIVYVAGTRAEEAEPAAT
jgi:Ca2+/Na+ antiporter